MAIIHAHTRLLNVSKSLGVNVSALAITGMRLTREPKRFMISMSRGFKLDLIIKIYD